VFARTVLAGWLCVVGVSCLPARPAPTVDKGAVPTIVYQDFTTRSYSCPLNRIVGSVTYENGVLGTGTSEEGSAFSGFAVGPVPRQGRTLKVRIDFRPLKRTDTRLVLRSWPEEWTLFAIAMRDDQLILETTKDGQYAERARLRIAGLPNLDKPDVKNDATTTSYRAEILLTGDMIRSKITCLDTRQVVGIVEGQFDDGGDLSHVFFGDAAAGPTEVATEWDNLRVTYDDRWDEEVHNLRTNPGYEQDEDYYFWTSKHDPPSLVYVDTSQAHTGARSLALVGGGKVLQPRAFKCLAGETFQIEFWCKAKLNRFDKKGLKKVDVMIGWHDTDGRWMSKPRPDRIPIEVNHAKPGEWNRTRYTLTIEEGYDRLGAFVLCMGSMGLEEGETVWYDDVRVTRVAD